MVILSHKPISRTSSSTIYSTVVTYHRTPTPSVEADSFHILDATTPQHPSPLINKNDQEKRVKKARKSLNAEVPLDPDAEDPPELVRVTEKSRIRAAAFKVMGWIIKGPESNSSGPGIHQERVERVNTLVEILRGVKDRYNHTGRRVEIFQGPDRVVLGKVIRETKIKEGQRQVEVLPDGEGETVFLKYTSAPAQLQMGIDTLNVTWRWLDPAPAPVKVRALEERN